MLSVNAIAHIESDTIAVKTITINGQERHVAEIRVSIRRAPVRGKKRKPVFIDLEVWGRAAENAAKYLGKHSAIGVTGELDHDEWTDKDTGKMRHKHKIIANKIEFLDKIGRRDGVPSAADATSADDSPADDFNPTDTVADDDIPF